MSDTISKCLGNETTCLISVSWGKLFTKCECYKVVVSSETNIIYVYGNESNVGDEKNWVQTMRPKFDRQSWPNLNEMGNSLYIKYFVSKAICKMSDVSMNILWKQRSVPRATAAVKKLTALLPTSSSVSPNARISAGIPVLNIFSWKPSAAHFQYGYHMETTQRTLSYGSSKEIDRSSPDTGICIT